MPRPSLRMRSKKRKRLNLPGAHGKIHYEKDKTAVSHCSFCGQPLAGIPSQARVLRKLSGSKRRIQRPYGGRLCSKCLKNLLKQAARTL